MFYFVLFWGLSKLSGIANQVAGQGIDRLRRLSESLSKREPRNAPLHLRVSKPFARVCGRDPVVLQLTIGMLESVKRVSPTVSRGHRLFLMYTIVII